MLLKVKKMGKLQRILTVISFIPCLCTAQIRILGLARVIVGGHNGGTTVAVDTSREFLVFSPVKDKSFDATRPNQRVDVTGDMFFNENNINPGYSGSLLIVNPSGFAITLNGSLSGTLPGSGAYIVNYTYSSGVVWTYP